MMICVSVREIQPKLAYVDIGNGFSGEVATSGGEIREYIDTDMISDRDYFEFCRLKKKNEREAAQFLLKCARSRYSDRARYAPEIYGGE